MSDFNENKRCLDNISTFSTKATVKEEAGAWLARIDQGELSAEETAQFLEWIGRSDFHRRYLEKLAQNWDSMAILQNLADLFPLSDCESFKSEYVKVREVKSAHSLVDGLLSCLRHPVSLGLCLVVCTSLAVFLLSSKQIAPNDFVTGVGEHSNVLLEDGSSIILNTDSHVRIDYSGDLRLVRLLRGEATFIVAKIPSRPFAVYAGGGMVWAVGTAFNVRHTSDLVDVTITEGVVKVYTQVDPKRLLSKPMTLANDSDKDTSESEVIVSAGQSVRFGRVIKVVEAIVPEMVERKLAWQHGALVFKGETLGQVVGEVSRYTEKELVIIDPAIKNIQIGGHFKINDIESFLGTLRHSFGINVDRIDDTHIYLSRTLQ